MARAYRECQFHPTLPDPITQMHRQAQIGSDESPKGNVVSEEGGSYLLNFRVPTPSSHLVYGTMVPPTRKWNPSGCGEPHQTKGLDDIPAFQPRADSYLNVRSMFLSHKQGVSGRSLCSSKELFQKSLLRSVLQTVKPCLTHPCPSSTEKKNHLTTP